MFAKGTEEREWIEKAIGTGMNTDEIALVALVGRLTGQPFDKVQETRMDVKFAIQRIWRELHNLSQAEDEAIERGG